MKTIKKYNYYFVVVFVVVLSGIILGLITRAGFNFRNDFLKSSSVYLLFIGFTGAVWYWTIWVLRMVYNNKKWYQRNYLQIFSTIILINLVLPILTDRLLIYILGKNQTVGDLTPSVELNAMFLFIVVSFLATILRFLKQELEFNGIKIEELNIARIQAEMDALKNQVEPHFIFNSLNALSYLILEDPKNAILYNDNLGKVYEYILSNKNHDLVKLTQEVEFISNYFFLMKIRFDRAVNLNIHIQQMAVRNYLIPPISLQVLIENAIKHNHFNTDNPLNIEISANSSFVIVKNVVRTKEFEHRSTGTGLVNLNNRYQLITNKNIIIEKEGIEFSVKLPLISG